MKINPLFLSKTLINRYEESYGTFGEEIKTLMLSMTLGQFAPQKNIYIYIFFQKQTMTMGWMLA
jgi:hypothetical protein